MHCCYVVSLRHTERKQEEESSWRVRIETHPVFVRLEQVFALQMDKIGLAPDERISFHLLFYGAIW